MDSQHLGNDGNGQRFGAEQMADFWNEQKVGTGLQTMNKPNTVSRSAGWHENTGNVGDAHENVESVVGTRESIGNIGEMRENSQNDWSNQGMLGQATLAMPQPSLAMPGAENLGVIINENDREREELTGERAVGTDRPKIQDREGLSAERMNYIERGIRERRNDLHALKRFATDEMVAELKGRYGRIFGSEN